MLLKFKQKKILGHVWLVLVISFHKKSFCYSGTCLCHNENHDKKNLDYSLLNRHFSALIQNAESHGNHYMAFPLNENIEHHLHKLQRNTVQSRGNSQ